MKKGKREKGKKGKKWGKVEILKDWVIKLHLREGFKKKTEESVTFSALGGGGWGGAAVTGHTP